jgi:cobalt-zinc-cadmium efflux system outer membrane protein
MVCAAPAPARAGEPPVEPIVAAQAGTPPPATTAAPALPAPAPPPATPTGTPGDTVTLEDVFRLLREKSPRTAADRTRIDLVAAETVAARVYPNPEIDYSSVHLTSGTNTGAADVRTLTAGEPLLIFGQRGQRKLQADLELHAVESDVAADAAARQRLARSQFTALLAGQDRVRLLSDAHGDLARVAAVVTARAEAGEKSRYDALRIDLELKQREADVAEARAEVEQAAGALAGTLGVPGGRPVASGALQPIGLDIGNEDALWSEAQAHLAALDAARREQEAAHQSIDLAKRERLPVPVLSAGGQFTQDAQSDSFLAGLSLPIPLTDRGQGPIARATARAAQADLELAARTAEVRADLHRALAVLTERRRTLETLDRDVMGRLPEVRRMSEDAYREGQSDILDLLDAARSRTAAELARVDAVVGVMEAEGDLLTLLGRAEATEATAAAGQSP